MSDPLVVTIILNTNRRDDTLECLASLAGGSYSNQRTIVLDNDSTDGSVPAIQAAFPAVEILPLVENRGYAGNNNVGIRAALDAGADWVLILNEDTVLERRCVEEMVRVGESDPRIGMVGPLVLHHDEPHCIQSAGGRLGPAWESIHRLRNEQAQGQDVTPLQVDWLTGCSLLVRRALIEQVGAIDERFFYYWEETEWCVRAGRQGWQMILAPAARLWHKGVQRDYQPGPSVTYYNTRNRFLMMQIHRAPLAAWLVTWFQLTRTLASWTLRPKWRSQHEHRRALRQGATDFLRRRWGMRAL